MKTKREILIVDDNLLDREMLIAMLKDDYRVLQAENGVVALDLLKKNNVDLILLDVVMPVMDGYTFLDKIRHDDELSSIPVIVLTPDSGEKVEVSALAHGATDFITQPYRPQIIRHRIEILSTSARPPLRSISSDTTDLRDCTVNSTFFRRLRKNF